MQIKDAYINCIAHNSSEGNLLLGEDYTALFDPGMIFCAGETIKKVKNALGERPLDYIFLTHTHYDHAGALPYFRRIWPGIKVAASEAGKENLLKSTPRRVIRELSLYALKAQGLKEDMEYSDDALYADLALKDGDTIPLGGLSVEAIEAPGHTKDSLCFFAAELELLILNETPGVLMPSGQVYPSFLSSFESTICSIEKLSKIKYKHLSLAHRGLVEKGEAKDFFAKSLAAAMACRNFIMDMKGRGLNEEEMLEAFYRHYWSDALNGFQPKEAFMINSRATISCVLREA